MTTLYEKDWERIMALRVENDNLRALLTQTQPKGDGMTDDKAPNFAQDALNFHWQECQRLTAELDHCRNSLDRAIDTSNHWSDAHAAAYARGFAAGLEAALQACFAVAYGRVMAGEQAGAERCAERIRRLAAPKETSG